MPVMLTPGRALAGHTNPRPTLNQAVSASAQAGQVITLGLVSNTLTPGNSLDANGIYPVAVAIDSRNGYLYVANRDSGTMTLIDDSTNKVVTSIHVGAGPEAVAFDSSNGDVYVANRYSGTVTVIDGATNYPVASIPVGDDPEGVAFDSLNGDLYVSNYYSNNVTVIDGTSNSVVAWIPVGSNPVGVGFDNSNGDVYVTNSGSDNVTVINGATNRVVTTIHVGLGPEAVAFDGSNGDLYVANTGSGFRGYIQAGKNVTVIDGGTNKVITSIPVGWGPIGVAFDSLNGDLYVTNYYSNNVTVINGATNRVIGGLLVGPVPDAVAFDASNGETYVVDLGLYSAGSVVAIDGATNEIVARIPVEAHPDGAVVDSSNGDLYVTNYWSNNVAVVDGTTNKVIAWVPVGSNPVGVAYDSSNGDVYVTNSDSRNVTVIDGSTNKVIDWVRVGFNPRGIAFDSANGDLYVANDFAIGNVTVIDGSTNKVVAWVPVGQGPVGVAFDSFNGDVYVTNRDSFNVTVINGATNRVVTTIPVGQQPNGIAFDSSNGYLYVANSFSVVANDVSVIDGATNRVVASISTGGYGQPYGVVSGGSNGEVYVTNLAADEVAVIYSATNKVAFRIPVGSTGGLNSQGIAINSSNGYVYVTNFDSGTVSIFSGLAIASVDANHAYVDVGQTDNFTCAALGGAPPYSFSWTFGDGSSGSGQLSSHMYATTGAMAATCIAVDGAGTWAGDITRVFVFPRLTVAVNASRLSVDVGQTVFFSAYVSGGSGGYVFDWSRFSPECSSLDTTLSCTPTDPGSFSVIVNVTDSNGYSITSPPANLTVSTDPTVTLVASSSSFLVGQGVSFSAAAQGGSGEYAYRWSGLPAGCNWATNSPNYSCTPSTAGTYNVRVTIMDANGVTSASSVRITVNPSFLGMPAAVGYAVLGSLVTIPAIGGTFTVVLLIRRRKASAHK